MERIGKMEKVSGTMKEVEGILAGNEAFQFWLFQQRWGAIAGEVLARESYIGRQEGATLYIYVTNSVWMQELMMYKAGLLQKLRQDPYGRRFQDIRFMAASARPAVTGGTAVEALRRRYEANEKPPSAPLTEEERAWMDTWICTHVEREALRRPIAAMMAGALRRRKAELAEGYHPCALCGDLCPPGDRLCPRCRIRQERLVRDRIVLLLKERPDLLYDDVRTGIPCTYGQFAEARDVLIHRYKERVYRDEGTEEDLRRLLSLLVHKPFGSISREEAEAALSGLPRRSRYLIERRIALREDPTEQKKKIDPEKC